MTDGTPPGDEWGDKGYPDWYRRVTGVGSSVKDAILIPALAVLTALIIGGFIIAVTDVDTLSLWGSDPGEAFRQTMSGIFDAYKALFVGSVGSPRAITESLFAATPLIFAGLIVTFTLDKFANKLQSP